MREAWEKWQLIKQIREAKRNNWNYCFCAISFSKNMDWLRRKGYVVVPTTSRDYRVSWE